MCSLFGVLDYSHTLSNSVLTRIVSALSHECEVRGTDATGIAYINRGELKVYKRPLPARRIKFKLPKNCRAVMGHTRLTTQGSEKFNYNNHPFSGNAGGVNFALAHNGVLRNDNGLRISEELPQTNIETDSYVAVQLIEKKNALDFDSLKHMAEKVEGSFTFTVLDQLGKLYFVKGDSPMCIYKFHTLGFYIYASTEEILNKAVTRLGLKEYEHNRVELFCGDMFSIDAQGNESKAGFEYSEAIPWRCYGSYWGNYKNSGLTSFVHDYWEELRSMAHYFGYLPDDIDCFRRMGYPPDAVEDMLYDGEIPTREYFAECM